MLLLQPLLLKIQLNQFSHPRPTPINFLSHQLFIQSISLTDLECLSFYRTIFPPWPFFVLWVCNGGAHACRMKAKFLAAVTEANWAEVADLFASAGAQLHADKDAALAAVSKSWLAFQHASDAIRADRDFIMVAVKAHGTGLLSYADRGLKADKAFILDVRMKL